MRTTHGWQTRRPPSGFVLVAVLVFILLLSMIATSLLFQFKAEDTAAAASGGAEQAWATALSGIDEAIRVASLAVPGTLEWQDNPRAFQDHLVYEDGSDRWYFSVFSEAGDGALAELRYGLSDEASRLNVNTTPALDLARLPQMTIALAQAIDDFVDSDDLQLPDGAEREYYETLPRPYAAANRPMESLDQLLLVRGFTSGLLYGEDWNINGHLDPNENDGDQNLPPDNRDSRLQWGLRENLTVTSYDPNTDASGQPRVNLNKFLVDLSFMTNLPAGLSNYLAVMRTTSNHIEYASDLLEAIVTTGEGTAAATNTASGVGKAELPLVLERFTGDPRASIQGLVNINTASAAILACLPELDISIAESIVSTRRALAPEKRASVAWLYQEGVLDASKFKQVAPRLTARSFQFRFQVLGYGLPSGRFRRLEVIIDTAGSTPRVRYLRDLTRLGLPFKLDSERFEGPRSGAEHRRRAPQPSIRSQISTHPRTSTHG